jgi:hypothetical protein
MIVETSMTLMDGSDANCVQAESEFDSWGCGTARTLDPPASGPVLVNQKLIMPSS